MLRERSLQHSNLDLLASEGVRYTQCICTAPVCSAARSALMTGMFQTSIGAHNHRSHRDRPYELPDGVRTVTDLFREAGYHTSNCRTPAAGLEVGGKTDFNFRVDKPLRRDGLERASRGLPVLRTGELPGNAQEVPAIRQGACRPGRGSAAAFLSGSSGGARGHRAVPSILPSTWMSR